MHEAAETSLEPTLSIASFLKGRREARGLTQQQLAEMTRIGLSTIKQYERQGGSDPTIGKAARLAEALQFDPRDLFAEVMELPPETSTTDESNLPIGAIELFAIEELVEERSPRAQFLPRLINHANTAMAKLTYNEFVELVDAMEFDEFELPDAGIMSENSKQMRGAFCDALQNHLVVHSVFGKEFYDLDLELLRRLHETLAEELAEEHPLENVPTRSLLQGFFASDEDNQRLRDGLLWELPRHLVRALRRGIVVDFEQLENNED